MQKFQKPTAATALDLLAILCRYVGSYALKIPISGWTAITKNPVHNFQLEI